jgi:hypothetical protein
LDESAVAEDADLVGERECLLLVVGDEQRGGACRSERGLDVDAQAGAKRRVERAEGLVEQDRLRGGRQCAGEFDPLLLAAGELVREMLAETGEPDQLEQLLYASFASAPPGESEGDVAGDGEPDPSAEPRSPYRTQSWSSRIP